MTSQPALYYGVCLLGGFVVLALIWKFRKKPILIFGFSWILAFLLPVLGFIPFAYQAISTTADHYMYLSMVGVSLWFSYGLVRIRLSQMNVIAALILILFAARASARAWIWKNDLSFYTAWREDNPTSHKGWSGLAELAYLQGNFVEAERMFREALKLNPNDSTSVANLGQAMSQQNRFADVIRELDLKLANPEFIAANRTRLYHMASLFSVLGSAHEALGEFQAAYDTYCKAKQFGATNDWLLGRLRDLSSRLPSVPPC